MTTSPADAVAAPLADAATAGKEVINDNMPIVFGVAIAFVAWNVGKRVLGKI
jgi:hypothetical protein